MTRRFEKDNPDRKIVAIIECDAMDRDITPCKVDENALGSCGQRADYCMWALWQDAKVIEYGKRKGYGKHTSRT